MTSAANTSDAPSPIATLPGDTPSDVVAAVVAERRRTFDTGRTHSLQWRRRQLQALSRLLDDNESEIVEALALDLGRPAADAWLADIGAIQLELKYVLRRLKSWMRDTRAVLPLVQQPGSGRVHREPLGVVLVIGPWNYPFYLTLGPLVGVLAAGNCAVIKPSELAPESARLIAELVPRYLDSDAVAVVEGGAATTTALLAQGFDHAFFTGSPEVGKKIMAGAAPHLTPVTLELGGKSPVIVTSDADIDVAARRIIWAKLVNSGQTCITPDYLLVSRDVLPKVVLALTTTLARFQKDSGTSALPIVNRRQFDRLSNLLVGHGGDIAAGGVTDPELLTIEPAIVVSPDPDSALMQDEIFGPLLPVVAVDGLDDAIQFVRARPKPLAIYLFSSSSKTADKVIARTSSGGVVVNHIGLHCMASALPFGGVGNSGMGAYHGHWGFETFSHRKAIVTKRTRPDPILLYPPVTDLKQRVLRWFF
ncbi:aldehyde dehydrogenase family protein [Antrihabitans stalactiti]|uniref:Aldehyde dehydrogenase n=1 Tax=Antrihabitans stalactiti TaxID=2584121 RepID=A0A848KEP8_9NOCA|nr:aldehyde dehydrogenase family protein [Antrihabitans stalactiti]NMN96701.1 aldehyde dehydrogenase family protein [Antrihabitans stalactiti]